MSKFEPYSNPCACGCGAVVTIKNSREHADGKRFFSRSCAAKFNTAERNKSKPRLVYTHQKRVGSRAPLRGGHALALCESA